MRTIIVVVAALALPYGAGATEEETYDDPAVAACEFAKKPFMTKAVTYIRTGSRIEGASVLISYTTEAMNTAPVAKSMKCTFKMKDGKYVFDDPIVDANQCDALVDRTGEIEKLTKADPVRVKFLSDLTACLDRIKAGLAVFKNRLAERDIPLISAGIYPIDPDRTLLGK